MKLSFVFSGLILLAHTLLAASQPLSESIRAVVSGPDYKHAHWGILIADRSSGAVIHELNADQLFAPASTTKLFSVAAALDAFGAGFRFVTPVVRRGEVDRSGSLKGDLILVASGDPTLGGRTSPDGSIAFKNVDHTYGGAAELTGPDPLAGLHELARRVAQAGIKRVQGEVMIDDRLFEPAESTGSGPSRVSPILVNDNVIDLLITPAAPGMPATVSSRPIAPGHAIDAQIETVGAGKETRIQRLPSRPGTIVVRGEIAAASKPLVRAYEVDDAATFARSLFIVALQRAGVTVNASPLVANRLELLPAREAVARLPRVAAFESPPFAESAKLILKVSHNLHASTLPLLLASKQGKRTLADGLRLQRDFLVRAGVDADSISFGGAAGGSRADFSTPRATVQLLRYMATRADFATYEAGLPILGVDGTLADLLPPDSPASGKVRAKTGTYTVGNTMNSRFLLTSKALAGYVTTRHGRELAFAMFINNTHLEKSTDSIREGKTLARLCELIYLHSGASAPGTD